MSAPENGAGAAPRNAGAEAQSVVGDGWDARVLEPSPPAVVDGEFFADDPVAGTEGAGSSLVPDGLPGDRTWTAWLADNPDHAQWVAAHWLGGDRALPPAPATLTQTRLALHRLAAYVVAPVRHSANGKFGLRWTAGGFGTPFFNDDTSMDRQIRIAGTDLFDQRGDEVHVTPITTLAAAAEALSSEIRTDAGAEPDSPELGDVNEPLAVDPAAAEFLGNWYGMAHAALEVVRADQSSVDVSRVQLWPGHFDPAIEVGDEDHRGSYGASPGDSGIDEPYLYVSVWWPDRLDLDTDDPAWNAPTFTGSILKLSDFPADRDPVEVAAEFWIQTRDRLG